MSLLLGDLHTIVTSDGVEFHVPDEDNRFLFYAGYGAPPIEYITRRGYLQHGETKVDYQLSPRSVTVTLWKKPACSRTEYWQNRAALHEILRPNRGGSLLFILEIPDGTKRAIYLDPNPGAVFAGSPDDNSWSISETLEFTAFNPIWFNPDAHIVTTIASANLDLVFPITFPIKFGTGGTNYQTTVIYTGSWVTYPTITLTGPYTFVEIENMTTGAAINLTVPVVAGNSRVITLTPGNLSIVDGSGVDHWGDLGDGSDIVNFNIRPDPQVAGGVNVIRAALYAVDANSSFTLSYNDRYFAI